MKKQTIYQETYSYSSGVALPILLIIIGFYFLAKNMGWIPQDNLFWPIFLMAVGVYLLLNKIRK